MTNVLAAYIVSPVLAYSTLANMVTKILPIEGGLPEKDLEAETKFNHVGRGLPSDRVAL
jgi:hypothetical protein